MNVRGRSDDRVPSSQESRKVLTVSFAGAVWAPAVVGHLVTRTTTRHLIA
jgi:hypothetical protein